VNDADVDIRRLALRVIGLDPDAARSLAQLVGQGLAPGMFRSAGAAGLDLVRIEVQATADEYEHTELLARRILAQISQQLDGQAAGWEVTR
jgi:hypothetical protein